jgi:hypothetical protein
MFNEKYPAYIVEIVDKLMNGKFTNKDKLKLDKMDSINYIEDDENIIGQIKDK